MTVRYNHIMFLMALLGGLNSKGGETGVQIHRESQRDKYRERKRLQEIERKTLQETER